MSDRWAVLLAGAAATGAAWAHAAPWWAVGTGLVLCTLTRSPVMVVVVAAMLCSTLAARSLDGLVAPTAAPIDGWATILTDPESVAGATRVDVRIGERRLQGWARGQAAAALRPRLAGERIRLAGTVGPLAPSAARRLRARHIAGRVSIIRVSEHDGGSPLARLANAIRRLFARGSRPLSPADRSLLAGFVLGDDREQTAALADDFRASGLTHLLAVSGQNVVFVLLLAGPALRRLGPRTRVVAALAVLVVFGTVTRWEPSVIRAVAMAAIALWSAGAGRPASSLRALCLAATGLLVIDPLLVHSVGFGLSVGACLGIATLSAPITRALPGPSWLRSAAGVTLAAQAGVCPILIPVFGGVPVAALPANLLAAPAAGPVMVWGLAAGLVAGLVGPPVDAVLHLPAVALLGWVKGVARWCAALPLGQLGTIHTLALAGCGAIGVRSGRRRRLVAVVAAMALLSPSVVALRPAPVDGAEVARGARLWRADRGAVLAVEGQPDGERLLAGLRLKGVRRIDVMVLSGRSSMSVLDVLRDRVPVRATAAPIDGNVSGAAPLEVGSEIGVGSLRLVVVSLEPKLRLGRAGATGAGGRPSPAGSGREGGAG